MERPLGSGCGLGGGGPTAGLEEGPAASPHPPGTTQRGVGMFQTFTAVVDGIHPKNISALPHGALVCLSWLLYIFETVGFSGIMQLPHWDNLTLTLGLGSSSIVRSGIKGPQCLATVHGSGASVISTGVSLRPG